EPRQRLRAHARALRRRVAKSLECSRDWFLPRLPAPFAVARRLVVIPDRLLAVLAAPQVQLPAIARRDSRFEHGRRVVAAAVLSRALAGPASTHGRSIDPHAAGTWMRPRDRSRSP